MWTIRHNINFWDLQALPISDALCLYERMDAVLWDIVSLDPNILLIIHMRHKKLKFNELI